MRHSDDSAYFRQREAQERRLAAQQHCPDARRVHLELAGLYADRVRELEFFDQFFPIRAAPRPIDTLTQACAGERSEVQLQLR